MMRFLKDYYGLILVVAAIAMLGLPGHVSLPWIGVGLDTVGEAILCAVAVTAFLLQRREAGLRRSAEERIDRLSRTDDLTGLPNRLAFREYYDREWKQALRTRAPLSVLHVDADLFKGYNGLYGHSEADDLLRIIADAIRTQLRRPRDVVGRYDGEEFVGLLPETDLAGARAVAENIRKAVMARSVVHERSQYGVATVSIGVATVKPAPDADQEALLMAADEALALAKSSGRNRVCSAEECLPQPAAAS